MKLPRGLSGSEVARLLARHYGYRAARTKGSHSVTVPRHRNIRVGTLDAIVGEVASFLGLSKRTVRETLFG